MSKEPILPWGTSGLDPTKGMQDRNLGNLLKILERKEVTEALTTMAKTDKDTWENIKDSVSDLKDFITYGGTSAIITSFKTTIEDSISFIISDKLSTFENTLNTLIGDKLDPMLDIINTIANSLATYIADNDTGAFVGAMGGWILGQILPGGAIWTAVGALLGAWLQDIIEKYSNLNDKIDEGFQYLYDNIEILKVTAEILSTLDLENTFWGSDLIEDTMTSLLEKLKEQLQYL